MDARSLTEATPATRDRFVDLLRVGSIAIVVLGHWVMAVLVSDDAGARADNVLRLVPNLQYLTWVLQVMPLFFLVGGFANHTALAKHPAYADFLRARTRRLLAPTLVFFGVWLALSLVTALVGVDGPAWRLATAGVAQPVWFIGVYLGVNALAPLTLAWHRRHGGAVVVVLALVAVGVDLLRFRFDQDSIAIANLLVVWVAVHQLGYLYAEGRLTRLAPALALGGLTGVLVLTGVGWYPVSMVGMPGAPVSNMNPPTVALLAQAVGLTGAVLVLRAPLNRWLARPAVWRVVVRANTVTMTVFLWHLTALFVGWTLLTATGLPQPEVGGPWWWLTRPGWVATLAAVTTGLVLLFRWAERVGPPASGGGPWRAGLAAAATVWGLLGVSVVGFDGLLTGRTVAMVGLPMTTPGALVLIGAGLVLGLPGHSMRRNLTKIP